VVQAWPPCRTYCRSSSQMSHREGGPAVGACWTAHVTQMYDFTDVRPCRRLRRRRYRWGGCWDEGLAARAALRVRAHWRRRRSKCSGERDSSAGRDDHRLLLPRAHLDGYRRHHRRRPLDERLHSLRRVLLPLARRRHVPGLRFLTGADGSVITLQTENVLTLTDAGVCCDLKVNWRVSDGTGRYAGLRGEGRGSRTLPGPATLDGQVHFDGP